MSKNNNWQNNVAEFATILEDNGIGVKESNKIIVKKDFNIKAKNKMILTRYSDLLESWLEKGIINQESFDKQMKLDISNRDNIELEVGKPVKFIQYLATIPPQEDKGEGRELKANDKGYINNVLEVRLSEKKTPYVVASGHLDFKTGDEVLLNDVEKNIRLNKNLSKEEKQEKLDKLKMEGSNQLWLQYTGTIGPKRDDNE